MEPEVFTTWHFTRTTLPASDLGDCRKCRDGGPVPDLLAEPAQDPQVSACGPSPRSTDPGQAASGTAQRGLEAGRPLRPPSVNQRNSQKEVDVIETDTEEPADKLWGLARRVRTLGTGRRGDFPRRQNFFFLRQPSAQLLNPLHGLNQSHGRQQGQWQVFEVSWAWTSIASVTDALSRQNRDRLLTE